MMDIAFEEGLQKEIEKFSIKKQFKAGDLIIDNGQPITLIPIITKGSVKVYRTSETGDELFLYTVNKNETCAMTFTCCMDKKISEVRVSAEEDCEILFIPSAYMEEWLMKYPSWKNFIMHTLNYRFTDLLKTIDAIAFLKLDERLVQYLIEKSNHIHSKVLHLTHQEIADDLATSRVVISRLLKKLESDKKVILYRNEIKLLSAL